MTATSVQINNIQIIHYVGNTKYVLRLYALYLIMIMTSVQINDIQIYIVWETLNYLLAVSVTIHLVQVSI